jgi:predicted transcriptional regulator
LSTQSAEGNTELAELLFELASPDRLTLLLQVAAKDQKMSSLAKAIGASVPECSRHLSRLASSGMITKSSKGLYETTTVGRTILKLLPGIEVVVRQREYLLSHDLSALPESFIERIGTLTRAEYLSHFGDVLVRIRTVISEAKEYSCLMVDKPILVGRGDLPTSFARKDHLPAKFIFDKRVGQRILSEVKAAYPRSEIGLWAGGKNIGVALGVTERSCGLIFPSLDGKLDFGSGFFGEDPKFRDWCSDLFDYWWMRSQKVHYDPSFPSISA